MSRHSLYRPVEAQVALPEIEERILRSWRDHNVFQRSIEQRADAPEWVFYEGPPTANGRPGIHHVEPRIFKDLFCRFQTMRGRLVRRKAGWDCHGLPVEIEVEKKLGITRKRQIEEEIGIERFTKLCRESVTRYVDDWEQFTDRIGFWLDLDDAYWTMDASYMESVWWLLKQIWDKGLLEEDFRVTPYCPRCETSLSSHEQHQTGTYRQVSDPSVYVRFPLADAPDTALLVWTTTPWTLLANMAAAVGPELLYAKVADPYAEGRFVIVAKERVEALFGEQARSVEEMSGEALLGRRYSPPFDFVDSGERGHTVRSGEFVTTSDGTGIVHLAPYGEDDMMVAKRDGLPIVQMIDPSGRVVENAGSFSGLWFKDADERIVADLENRDVLFRTEIYEHAYPHCWRCRTPLLYYPHKDWYIRTSQIRDQLQASNETTDWQPPTIKHGRFGDWLANNVDWSLSRDRYWGTPLPIWRCEQGHLTCVGSFAELSELAGRDLGGIDPHRPFIDEVTLACPQCRAEAKRVTSVIDTWFDSGAMPFAQWHYPFENEEEWSRRFPADFISEAIDQTRGWFYSLLAIATLVTGGNSYRNVVCLGHIVDAEGRKMSKSLGNILDPWTVLEDQGADALRWYMFTSGTPWSARRVSSEIVHETMRKYLLTLWNTYSFWVTYASLERFSPTDESPPVHKRAEVDRWILAELDDTVREVTRSLEGFDATAGGRRIDRFVDDLSNWYVRRSRRRFWHSKQDVDTRAAFATLWECLVATAKLTAPYTPFIADEIYSNITAPIEDAPDSVHLADWPLPDDALKDESLRTRMALVRRLVALGRAARTDAGVRVRQPLERAIVVIPATEVDELHGLESLVCEELNVRSIEPATAIEELVSYSVKPNFKVLGPRLGARVKDVATALQRANAREIVSSVTEHGSATVAADGADVALSADELDIRVQGREGFSLAQDGPYGVALDLDITPDLRAEGMAREVTRALQDLRKSLDLRVEDRIELWMSASEPGVAAALEAHRAAIAEEVLATETHISETPPADAVVDEVKLDHGAVTIALRRAPRST
ncbi:isoleucine--tRNA ligase [soil metagenome]